MKSDRSFLSSKGRSKTKRAMSVDKVLKQVLFLLSAVGIALLFMLMKILYTLPIVKSKVYKLFENVSMLKKSQFEGCILTWEMYKTVLYDIKQNIFKKAALGQSIPDVYLHKVPFNASQVQELSQNYASETKAGLFSLRCLVRPGVPLILNFGSCS